MNKYIELISNIEMGSIVNNIETKEINYKFNVSDPEECKKEIAKLIYFFWHTYINSDCIRLYFLNDILLYFEEKMLRYIKTLLDYTVDKGLKDEAQLLSYYLVSLNYSYSHGKRYSENEKNTEYLKLFYSVFEKREFYKEGSIITRATEFAREVIYYAVKDKENIINLNDLLLDCCRICSSDNCPEFQERINQLICFETHYNHDFIKYDKNIEGNSKIYFDFELSRISEGTDDDLTVLKELYKNGLINKDKEEKILSTFENRFSNIIGEGNYTIKIAKLERLENDIVSLRNLNYTSPDLKENLKAIILKIQNTKRDWVKYQEPELCTIESKTEIPREYIEKIMMGYETDIIGTIFRQCLVRFDNYIEDSIKRMVDSIVSFASTFTIDNKEEGLFTGDDTDVPNSAFNIYYSDRMENFFKDNKTKFSNAHLFNKKDAYRGFLNYTKFIFPIHMSLPESLLIEKFGDEVEKIIFEKLGLLQDNYFNDYYIMLMSMIIHIEGSLTQLYNYFESEHKNCFTEMYLERVFEHVQDKEEGYANGLMYINFVLYDKNGLRLRDRIGHGNFESGFRILKVFLMILTSLIIASTIYNNFLGENHEG